MTKEEIQCFSPGDRITITGEYAGISYFGDTIFLRIDGTDVLFPVSIDLVLERGRKLVEKKGNKK